jgi:hypothetical protein
LVPKVTAVFWAAAGRATLAARAVAPIMRAVRVMVILSVVYLVGILMLGL